jgi:DNA-binding MarR family transcriptional regulator
MRPDPTTLDTRGLQPVMGFLLAVADVPLRRVFQRAVAGPFELRAVEFSLLVLLLDNPGAAPKQLGAALNLSPPNTTVLLDRLVARGLIERRRSATDGRAQQVLLTDKGAGLARRAHTVSLTMEDGVLQALSPGERTLLRELLVKLARSAAGAGGAAIGSDEAG